MRVIWIKDLCASLVLTLAASNAWADVRLPGLIGSGMVLQRDAKATIWGWANPGEAVRVEFRATAVRVKTGRDGRWSVYLGPYPAGGPYDLTITGKNTLRLRDVFIGDVWIASGQSNMEFPLKGNAEWRANNSEWEVSTARFPRIRLFMVQENAYLKPESDIHVKETWHPVTPENAGSFSAVAYLFAREIHQRYQVPIGVIDSAVGGTVIEAWISARALRLPDFHKTIGLLERVNPKTRVNYARLLQKRESWYRQHSQDDRGLTGGRAIWADPSLDVSGWPTASLPRPVRRCGEDLNGFRGVAWFRRTVILPVQQADPDVVLHLGRIVQDDVTYFNGEKVGETAGSDKPRIYMIPRTLVHSGKNTVAVRVSGLHGVDGGCTGMYMEDPPSADVGAVKISLTGRWFYQSGPDLTDFPRMDEATLAAAPVSPNRPTMLFNSMIRPLLPFKIKGVIWYQGEANALDGAAQYRALFPALIRDRRQQWGYQFPFLFVQLAGFGPNQNEPADYPWADLREAQDMTLALTATGMTTAVDIGDESDIHPKNKQDVAHRLALAAEKVAYGENIAYSGPRYQSMHIQGGQVLIRFSCLGSSIVIKDKYGYGRGFEIAGADGKFHWAQAHQDGEDSILVSSESVPHPATVRYDWSNTPDGNVYNQAGLPAVPFRMDFPHSSSKEPR